MHKTNIYFAALLILLSVLFVRIFSLGMADHYARSHPERALFWRSSHPEALFRQADSHAQRQQWPEAEEFARRAIRANPLDGRAMRILAQCEAARGNNKRAVEYYRKAAFYAPRDLQSHVWLLQHALQTRNALSSVQHLDALLRIKPALITSLRAQANALAANPVTRSAMVQALSESPQWRRDFLVELAKSESRSADLAPFFEELAMRSELSTDEFQPWLERLRGEQSYTQAYVTWANLIPPAQRKYLGTLFDGGFEVPFENQIAPYGWNSKPISNAYILWTGTRGSVGSGSFGVQFEGRRTPFDHLWQSLVLTEGRWLLLWRAKASRLDNNRGLVWRITCESDGRVLAESEPMNGQFEWRELELSFKVPPNCLGQRLGLLIPARIPAETLVNGALWLDEVRIQPESELL